MHVHTGAHRCDCEPEPEVRRCQVCGALFENGVADPGPAGEPRCPQCGFWESEPAVAGEDDFVIAIGTKFR